MLIWNSCKIEFSCTLMDTFSIMSSDFIIIFFLND